jgi:peptidoglycan hydrolase-like protein with peptidoglycan-binding domain
MHYAPKHAPAGKRRPLRNRIVGMAIAGSAIFVTGIGVSVPAQARSVWDSVAACESGGNWSINTGNGYYGGLQFSSSTWKAYGGTRYASSAHRASKAAQIAIAQRVLASQGPGAWPTCGRRAGLSRANSGFATTVSRSRTRTAIHAVSGKLAVDGAMGPRTTRAIQRWVGTTPDGAFGTRSVKALQRKVGVRPDGAIGRQTIRALQAKIHTRRDGARRLNSHTVAALQRYLNSH